MGPHAYKPISILYARTRRVNRTHGTEPTHDAPHIPPDVATCGKHSSSGEPQRSPTPEIERSWKPLTALLAVQRAGGYEPSARPHARAAS